MYKLEYLPLALQDMVEIASYISHNLKNPSIAERLSVKLVEAADNITTFPYGHPVYQSIKLLQREYRKLSVEDYLMFYWIDEPSKKITIARVIYAKRNYENRLEGRSRNLKIKLKTLNAKKTVM